MKLKQIVSVVLLSTLMTTSVLAAGNLVENKERNLNQVVEVSRQEKLKIISVDNIDSQTITVTIEPHKTDLIGVTVKAKPARSNLLYKSQAVDILKGATKVTFPLKDQIPAESLGDLAIWRVNDAKYYFNEAHYVSYLISGANREHEYGILHAISDSKMDNVNFDYLGLYEDAIRPNSWRLKTVAEIQAIIDKVNTQMIKDDLKITDIGNDWSKDYVKKALANGLLKGYNGKVRPGERLTRAEMASFIKRVRRFPEEISLSDFTDISKSDWFYEDMKNSVALGIFKGDGGKLRPEENITREEAFVILNRAFAISDSSTNILSTFPDEDQVSSWAKDDVAALISEGYVNGAEGYIRPKRDITRAELAKIIDEIKFFLD